MLPVLTQTSLPIIPDSSMKMQMHSTWNLYTVNFSVLNTLWKAKFVNYNTRFINCNTLRFLLTLIFLLILNTKVCGMLLRTIDPTLNCDWSNRLDTLWHSELCSEVRDYTCPSVTTNFMDSITYMLRIYPCKCFVSQLITICDITGKAAFVIHQLIHARVCLFFDWLTFWSWCVPVCCFVNLLLCLSLFVSI